jgi:hypothetical protein
METETIEIRGAEVTIYWGEGPELGRAVCTVPSDKVGDIGPFDGERFILRGVEYALGSHDYSTDQPGQEDDKKCTCKADIRLAD